MYAGTPCPDLFVCEVLLGTRVVAEVPVEASVRRRILIGMESKVPLAFGLRMGFNKRASQLAQIFYVAN